MSSATSFGTQSLQVPTIATVMEDNYWYYGKQKTPVKVNIGRLFTLPKEKAEPTTFIENKSNPIIHDQTINNGKKVLNYILIDVPDAYYTYPSERKVKNDKKTLHGATADYVPEGHSKPLDNGTNGEKKLAMVRVLPKNTRLAIIFLDNNIGNEHNRKDGEAKNSNDFIIDEEGNKIFRNMNVRVVAKYDDATEFVDAVLSGAALGNTGGISNLTARSATNGGRYRGH